MTSASRASAPEASVRHVRITMRGEAAPTGFRARTRQWAAKGNDARVDKVNQATCRCATVPNARVNHDARETSTRSSRRHQIARQSVREDALLLIHSVEARNAACPWNVQARMLADATRAQCEPTRRPTTMPATPRATRVKLLLVVHAHPVALTTKRFRDAIRNLCEQIATAGTDTPDKQTTSMWASKVSRVSPLHQQPTRTCCWFSQASLSFSS